MERCRSKEDEGDAVFFVVVAGRKRQNLSLLAPFAALTLEVVLEENTLSPPQVLRLCDDSLDLLPRPLPPITPGTAQPQQVDEGVGC